MQIRETDKLSLHKADFSQNREVCATFLNGLDHRQSANFLNF